jgi:hypothetical protein
MPYKKADIMRALGSLNIVTALIKCRFVPDDNKDIMSNQIVAMIALMPV